MPPDSTAPNADQIAYWNSDAGEKWARLQERLDGLFADISTAAIAAAAPARGARVLDVGCGCGATVLALAGAVGEDGHVLGVDISAPMLDVARQRLAAKDLRHAEVLLADAATHHLADRGADLVFSRFGVMFFDAPTEAFINIHKALKPGGRLFFACWRPFRDNPWFAIPYKAAAPHLPPQERPDPEAPGPFSFADPDRVRRILGVAGFSQVAIEPFDAVLPLGPHGEVEATTRFAIQIGPVSRALATGSPDERATAEKAVAAALATHDGPDGIRLAAQLWFVSAVA